MKRTSRVAKILFFAVSLVCIGIVLWPPRDNGLRIGSTAFVWAGLGNMRLDRPYQIDRTDGLTEHRIQIGPVLAVHESVKK
jgi:hypothetical protein